MRNLTEKDAFDKYKTIYCIDDYPDKNVTITISFVKPVINSCR